MNHLLFSSESLGKRPVVAPAISPARAAPASASPSARLPSPASLAPVESLVTPKKATNSLSAPREEVCSPQVNHLDRKVAITEKRINEEADRMKKDSEKVGCL